MQGCRSCPGAHQEVAAQREGAVHVLQVARAGALRHDGEAVQRPQRDVAVCGVAGRGHQRGGGAWDEGLRRHRQAHKSLKARVRK